MKVETEFRYSDKLLLSLKSVGELEGCARDEALVASVQRLLSLWRDMKVRKK